MTAPVVVASVGLRGWLDRMLGVTEAREDRARSEHVVEEFHKAVDETRAVARERRRIVALKAQDWPQLYQDRLEDSVR